jgi:HK97 family phage major capsid protein
LRRGLFVFTFFNNEGVKMQSIQALRERRANNLREIRNLLDNNPGAKWGADQQKSYDRLLGDVERDEAELQRIEKVLAKEAEKGFPEANRELDRIAGRAMSKQVRATLDQLGYDAEAHEARIQRLQGLRQVDAPGRAGRHGGRVGDHPQHDVVGTTTQGGFTVQTDVAAVLIDYLKDYSGMRQVAEIFTTSQGNPLNFPTSDGTAETGELIGENVTATGLDPSFGVVSIPVYKYSSKIIAVPFELLQDSQIDMEAFLRKRIQTRLGRIQNTHFTVGTGSGQPNGLVTAASVGKTGTTGQTLTVIYDDLVDLIDSVDVAYQGQQCKFMFAQSLRKVVRKIKDTQGRPIWMPSYEAGISQSFADNLLGYGVQINNDMPVAGANNKSISFGDHSYYKIRQVMEVMLFRFMDSAYVKLGQIGFLAWMRAGGNLVDAERSQALPAQRDVIPLPPGRSAQQRRRRSASRASPTHWRAARLFLSGLDERPVFLPISEVLQ